MATAIAPNIKFSKTLKTCSVTKIYAQNRDGRLKI